MSEIKIPKKLIEVALPLDDINAAAAREKSIRHGHPSTLHLWWARRPLAVARAVIFAQMVNDPSETIKGDRRTRAFRQKVENEREKLFEIIRELVTWENTNSEVVLSRARDAIRESWRFTCELNKNHPKADELFNPDKVPAFHDPFAGGGAIPLEAQRLGLESHASDLNPVAAMINKAMIEIPPKFIGSKPVGPSLPGEKQSDLLVEWDGVRGLAEDLRRYGHWIREQAYERVGYLYPDLDVTSEMIVERPDLAPYKGEKLKVIAWLWARTIKSPNPAFSHVDVPLVRSFIVSSKKGKEAWVETSVNGDSYSFDIRLGKPPKSAEKGTVERSGATCLLSNTAIPFKYIRDEAKNQRMGQRLMAIVAEGPKGRVFLSPTPESEQIALSVKSERFSEAEICHWPGRTNVVEYGMTRFLDLFTMRQLAALTTFSDLVLEARSMAINDAIKAGMPDDTVGLEQGGTGATAYGDALAVYLAFALDRSTNTLCSIARWTADRQQTVTAFSRQAIPMTWDFPEVNPFSGAAGDYCVSLAGVIKGIPDIKQQPGHVYQSDASTQSISQEKVISTDPPYYDNIGYADLSDFFYIWLRRSLRNVYPSLFSTMAVPKAEELIASPYRHGGKERAETFFVGGMTRAIQNLAQKAHPAFPISIYYAFKQSETKEGSTTSTGWVTFLEAVIQAGFSIDGTWPMRTEMANRMIGSGTNALASSIVLVCRKRGRSVSNISRRQFQRELRECMPEALAAMIGGESGQVSPIAPVDLAQSAIGPGIAIYSKYNEVLNQDGSRMNVHDALILINRTITEFLNPDSGNFDTDTLFCDDWFSHYGWSSGSFGEADTLARAKGTSVDGVREAGVIESGSGKVRLLKWSEYPTDWDPKTDNRTPVWEACHQMIRVLNQQGEADAGALLARMPEQGEHIRQLAYHLYTLCERKKWAEEARAYNELIGSWHAIVAASQEAGERGSQSELGFDF